MSVMGLTIAHLAFHVEDTTGSGACSWCCERDIVVSYAATAASAGGADT